MAADADPRVRAAALVAAADLGPDAAPLLRAALADKDPVVLLAAMRVLRHAPDPAAEGPLKALLAHPADLVRATALQTLTVLNAPPSPAGIKPLLADPSAAVRIAALQALAASTQTTPFPEGVPALRELAASASPGEAALAIEALGRFDWPASRAAIEAASASPNPLGRRGACNACRWAGQGQAVVKFLDDPSPMVRLAAIRAAGQLKVPGCEGKLFALMTAARHEGGFESRGEYDERRLRPAPPPDGAHQAALAALERMGTPEAAALALKFVADNTEPLADREHAAEALRLKRRGLPVEQVDALEQLRRNMAAACRLLGASRNEQAVEALGRLLEQLAQYRDGVTAVNASAVEDAADALARLADPRGIEPLRRAWRSVAKQTPPYLAELPKTAHDPVTFGHPAAAAIIRALGALKSPEGIDDVLGMLDLAPDGRGLTLEYVEALSAFPGAASGARETRLRTLVARTLKSRVNISDENGATRRRYSAARAAVALKMTELVPTLRAHLSGGGDDRPYRLCVGWAIQELTGQTPSLPAPPTAAGTWIVRPLVR